MKKQSKTQRITAMLATNPELTPKEIAKRLKVSTNLVHQVKWQTKKNSEFVNNVFTKVGLKKGKTSKNYTSNLTKAIKNTTAQFAALAKRPTKLLIQPDQIDDALTILNAQQSDPVNHPAHYKAGGIETIDFIEAKDLNYRLGNVIKYVSRAGKKDSNPVQDLEKAAWYLNREIEVRKRA